MTIVDVKQIIYALERQERALQAHADRLHDQRDYSAEFPAADADRMREAIVLLSAKPTTDHDRINDESAARLIEHFGLRVNGVGRDLDDERTLTVYFNRRPTDDEMRAVHEQLRPLSVGGPDVNTADVRDTTYDTPLPVFWNKELGLDARLPIVREDGWRSYDGGLSWQHPAPHGAAPMVPSGVQVVVPIGREPSRPGDLVPLANGRSVDLGGRST